MTNRDAREHRWLRLDQPGPGHRHSRAFAGSARALWRTGLALSLLAGSYMSPVHPVTTGNAAGTLGTRLGLRAGPAVAQEAVAPARSASDFSLDRIHGSSDFNPEGYRAVWLPDGTSWALLEADSDGDMEMWRVVAATGQRTPLIAAAELSVPGADEPFQIESFSFSADGMRVLLFGNAQQVWRSRTRGKYYVFDLQTRALTAVSHAPGWQMFAKFSPDGARVAFVRDHDLWVADLGSGRETRLTRDGSETIINGTTDWVYEEELNLRDAFRWSPDGARIAYWQLDQSPIREFNLIDDLHLYPEVIPVRYPKAGTANSRVRVGSLDLATGRTTWFDLDSDENIYVSRMEWAASSDEVVIQRLNRLQNRVDLLLGNAATGATRVFLTETDDAWVDTQDGPVWIAGGSRFLWQSDRDGWNHLYLYERDGTLVRQLTQGPWEVTALHGVDEVAGHVFFTAAFESTITRQLLSVELAGGEPRELLGGRGVHDPAFSPDFTYFIDSHSTIDTPPTSILYRVKGRRVETVRPLEENAALVARLDSVALAPVEFLHVKAADGTPLNAYMVRPPDFDSEKQYGLLVYVYGGPGSQTVIDSWGGSRQLWHHYLARKGVLVVSVDNRGTGGRGRDFKKQTYLRLGHLETADQLAAISEFGDLPYVDAQRIGIWGWSYGGFMSLNVLFQSHGLLAAGVSVAPVTHWRLYDTIYTERYMRTPQENPEGYNEGSPLAHAAELESPLLVIHGTGDDNVHFQNTVVLVQELEAANKQFRLRLYPNKRHGIGGFTARVNLFRMATSFLLENLGATAEGLVGG